MEKRLKCVLLLPLKEMALRKVAVLLWNGSDILASVLKMNPTNFSDEEWREVIEDKIKDKMLKLELPESLTKQMIDIVRPFGLEVKAWMKVHHPFLSASHIAFPFSIKLCWTISGAINYKRTAEELVRCDEFDVMQRYELACYHCLEDYIPLCWEELSQEKKCRYCNDEDPLRYLSNCWPYILKGEHSKLDYLVRKLNPNLTSFNQWAFESSAEKGRISATEYFFKKLTKEEREASLVPTAHVVIWVARCVGHYAMVKRSDLLCYLLSVMTPDQQMEIIKAHPVEVFLCFLCWPLQDLFMENAGIFWPFFPPDSYSALLEKIISGCDFLFCFPKIFKEFFMESPQDFKKWFVGKERVFDTPAARLMSTFSRSHDSESIEVLFRSLDAADRVKLVFYVRVLSFFYHCMRKDRWHLVEVCLREAMLSKEEKKRLKVAFTRFLKREGLKNPRCKRFFEFLNKTDPSSDKREKGQKRKLKNGSPEQ